MQSISESQKPLPKESSNFAGQQQTTNPKTGKVERVFVNLEAVYPNPENPAEEYSFEELRARSRGWLDRDWAAEKKQARHQAESVRENKAESVSLEIIDPDTLIAQGSEQDPTSQHTTEQLVETAPVEDMTQGTKARKSRRPKVMEVKSETQTSKHQERSLLSPLLTQQ